jgi:DNA-binding NarL/FixJ family response regulator
MNVLLVEDSIIVRDRISELLSDLDDVIVVGVADDVAPAITALNAAHPDLVILDIKLKASNGCDLLAYMLKQPMQAKVFVFSNLENEFLTELYLKHGADRVFDKAKDFFALHDAVAALAQGVSNA